VTIRLHKGFSFQIYLNNGMFLFFKTDSQDNQAAWMADLKAALGNVQFHVRVAGEATGNAFSLDHALLYCIGVNLPTHSKDHLDRVLVLASPINDVNIYAWNMSRIVQFMLIDAGIQMELCPSCMGLHRKKVITFLIRHDFKHRCMEFLLREMESINSLQQNPFANSSSVYNMLHKCDNPPEPVRLPDQPLTVPVPASPSSPDYYNDSELAVLLQDHFRGHSLRSRLTLTKSKNHGYSSTSTVTAQSCAAPQLPPRDQPRVIPSEPDHSQTMEDDSQNFDVPYHISHRIYINEVGIMTKESHILGSGSGEFRHLSSRPSVPPRSDSNEAKNPAYVSTEQFQPPSPIPPSFVRPEFVGRRPPVLPPRGITRHDMEQQDVRGGYTNVRRAESQLSLCTDDVINADLELLTRVSFKNFIPSSCLPPRSQITSKPPIPLPRKRAKSSSSSNPTFSSAENPVVASQQASVGPATTTQHSSSSQSSIEEIKEEDYPGGGNQTKLRSESSV
jgi:hypothetical protein